MLGVRARESQLFTVYAAGHESRCAIGNWRVRNGGNGSMYRQGGRGLYANLYVCIEKQKIKLQSQCQTY